MCRLAQPGVIGLFLLTSTAGANAEGANPARALVALSYDAPAGCPDSTSVLRRVEALVRKPPQSPMVARAHIVQTKGYQLDLDVEGGHRSITSESCPSLVETLAVILALTIDPSARIAPPDASPSGSSSDAPASPGGSPKGQAAASIDPALSAAAAPQSPDAAMAVRDGASEDGAPNLPDAGKTAGQRAAGQSPMSANPAPTSGDRLPPHAAPLPTASAAAAKRVAHNAEATSDRQNRQAANDQSSTTHPNPWRWGVQSLAWVEHGMLGSTAWGARLGVRLETGPWSFSAQAVGLLPQWVQMQGVSGHRGGTLSFVGGEVAVCHQIGLGESLLGCVGLELGDLMGKGGDGGTSRLGHGFWLAANSGIVLRPAISTNLKGELQLGLGVPLRSLRYGIDGNDWRFEPSRLSLRLAVGIAWRG